MKKINQPLHLLLAGCCLIGCCLACSNKPTKKLSLQLPKPHYSYTTDTLPFRFEQSDQARFTARTTKKGEIFCNLLYPQLDAQVYATWHAIEKEQFEQYAKEAHRLVYQHTTVATAIHIKEYSNPQRETYGLLYQLEGKVATPIQFSLTDSTSYFFTASLYFNHSANSDSLRSTLEYIQLDIRRWMDTFELNRH